MQSAAMTRSGMPMAMIVAGAVLIALGIWASVSLHAWLLAAPAGAAGLALWRFVLTSKPFAPAQIVVDAVAFAIFAVMRNDSIGFWQLPGPWSDVPHFNASGAIIALIVYVAGSLAALLSGYRGLRIIESVGLIAIPFLFNLVMVMGADWHMQE